MSQPSIESIIKSGIGRRKSAEAAAKKSARLQTAGTKKKRRTSAKSTARKAAGQKALKRNGTGCIVKSIKNRAGAKETLAYASDNDKNELIFSNCGSDNAAQEATMNAVANLRQDCIKNTGHITISLGKQNSFSPEKWRELVEFALDELEIDRDNFASVAYMHKDTKNPHIHICYSRVGYDSKINDSHHIGDLGIATAQKIEVKFGLILTPRNDNRGKKPPSQGMLERYRRTGETPKLILLQASIDAAMEGSKSMHEFQNRLLLIGVNTQFNVQEKDGKPHVSGLTYAFSDGSFKASASALGDRYGLYSLKKKGLVYEPAAINERHEAPSEPVNNKPVSQEDARSNNNDNGRADSAQPAIIQAGTGAGETEPASQSSTERRKLRRAAERAAAQTPVNIIVSDARVGLAVDTDSVDYKIKVQQVKNVEAWKGEMQEDAQANHFLIGKRINDAKLFEQDRYKYDTNLANKFRHLVVKGLKPNANIEEKEGEIVKLLLPHHNEAEIVETLCNHSFLHKPMPKSILLNKNAPNDVLETAARIEREREAIIAEAKAIVEKAKRELEALQRSTKQEPQATAQWTPPQPTQYNLTNPHTARACACTF